MKKSNFNKPIMCGILSFIAVFAFAKPDKVIQIFRNGEVIQEYDVSDIDYIEVNDRTPVPDNPDKPDKPDNPDNPKEPDNGVITGTAEPHAFRALLHGQYSGNKLPESVGFEYSYDSSFPKNKTASITTSGRFGGYELEALGMVDQIKVYYRAFATVDGKTIYGKTNSLTTKPGTYTIDGKTYNFIKVTGLSTGSFSMMQTELPPAAEVTIDGIEVGILDRNSSEPVTAGETREFMNQFAQAAVVPRYPTAQEWMFAAAGGSASKGFIYSGSNDIDEVAWYADNANGRARKPAQKEPNELGFYDMSGNYAELCSSYDEEDLEDIREKYISMFLHSIKDCNARYFSLSWGAEGGAMGGNWSSTASKCKSNSWEEYKTPGSTNRFDSSKYTVRFVYSRPD